MHREPSIRRSPGTSVVAECGAGPLRLRLTRYAAGTIQAPHDHAAPSLALVVGGCFEESLGACGTGAAELAPGCVLVKPSRTVHADRFRCDTLLFAIDC